MKIRRILAAAALLIMTCALSMTFAVRSKGEEKPDEKAVGEVHALAFHGRHYFGIHYYAKEFYNTLLLNKLPGYKTESSNIHLAGNYDHFMKKDSTMTRDEVNKELDNAFEKCGPNDLAIFYYTGHCTNGLCENKNEEARNNRESSYAFYFGWDYLDLKNEVPKDIKASSGFNYTYDDFLFKLKSYEFDKMVIIIDGCCAARIKDSLDEFPDQEFVKKLYVITSTNVNETEMYDPFTSRVIRGSGRDKVVYKMYEEGDPISSNGYLNEPMISADTNKDGVVDLEEAYQSGKGLINTPRKFCKGDASKCPLFQFQYLDMDKDNLKVYEGSELAETLKAERHYEKEKEIDKFEIRWTSEDEKIATVDKEGKVTGVSEGTTKITAHLYTADGIECIGADCSCNVEVAKVVTDIEDGDYSVYVGEDISLPYTVEGKDKNTKWTSSDESIATVDSKGKVKGVKPGVATITLEANYKTDSVTISVEEPYIEADPLTLITGESKQLPYKIYGPKGDIKFSSSDESVASVDKIGVVTAHKAGTANITLKANGVETVIKVTVEDEPNSPYMAFLEKYEGDGEAAFNRVAGEYGDRTEIHYFYITDLNKDGIDDLLTYEIVNFRYEKIKAFTLDDKNNIVPFKFEDGSDVLFDNNHQANGAFDFVLCSEGHIHNNYGGGGVRDDKIYTVDGNTIAFYLRCEEIYLTQKTNCTKYGSEISLSEYQSLTENCKTVKIPWILNNAEGRESSGAYK